MKLKSNKNEMQPECGKKPQNKNENEEKEKVNAQKKKYEEKNTYIRSVKPLSFPEELKVIISSIAAGAEFAFA